MAADEEPGEICRGQGHRYYCELKQPSPANNLPVDADTIEVKAYLTSTPYGAALTATTVDPLTPLSDAAYNHGHWGLLSHTLADAAIATFGTVYEEYFDADTGARLGKPRELRVVGW